MVTHRSVKHNGDDTHEGSIGKRQMVRKYSKAVLRPPVQMEQTALGFPLPRRGKPGTWTSLLHTMLIFCSYLLLLSSDSLQ
jgi:hypothetical protein